VHRIWGCGLGLLSALVFAASAGAQTQAPLVVSNTNDAGEGSLREAINAANSVEGWDLIDLTGVSGTIQLESPLPQITDQVVISGPGSDKLTVRRSGGGAYRILDIPASEEYAMGSYSISGLTLARGHAAEGGGMRIGSGADITLRDVVIRGNTADEAGGGILHVGYRLILEDSTIADNEARNGGGIHVRTPRSTTALIVRGSTVSGNAAWWRGGGIAVEADSPYVDHTAIEVVRSTIAENSVGDELTGIGGGIWKQGIDSTLRIERSTVARNAAVHGANVHATYPVLHGAIVAEAVGGSSCVGSFGVSEGHNVVDDESCDYEGGEGDQVGVDPLLGPLTDNGGPTLTMAPRPGSPAIDQGYFTSPDQRGLDVFDFPGIANAPGGNGADVGAVEVQDVAPPTVKIKRTRVNRKRRAVAVRFAARDDAATPAQLELACKLDRRKFRPCSSPVKYKRLAPGRHRVVVRATDLAGKTTRAAKRFRVPKPKAKRGRR
jgi:hypothetical protein